MIQAFVKAAHRDGLSTDVDISVGVTAKRQTIQADVKAAHRDSLSADVDSSVGVTTKDKRYRLLLR